MEYKTYEGKTLPKLCMEHNIKYTTVKYRLKNGWSLDRALSIPPLTPSQIHKKYDIEGKIFKDRFGNEFIVEDMVGRDSYRAARYKVRFLKSGYETIAVSSQIRGNRNTHVQDRLSPSVFGVGIMGYATINDDPKMFDAWRAMIARCYNPKNPRYNTYGAKGITVCDRWKRFDYFIQDVVKLPGYDKELINAGVLVLDKDIIDRSKMMYSPETCSFITKGVNTKEAMSRKYHKKYV